MKTGIKIVSVSYVSGYTLRITFSDGKVVNYDYANLVFRGHQECEPYKKISEFKKFQFDGSKVFWGEDWDMLLPIETLYSAGK